MAREKRDPFKWSLYEYHERTRRCVVNELDIFARITYVELFGLFPPENVHHVLLHRANGYEIMHRNGDMRSELLFERRKEALTLTVAAISDPVSRNLVRYRTGSLGETVEEIALRPQTLENHTTPRGDYGSWAVKQFNVVNPHE